MEFTLPVVLKGLGVASSVSIAATGVVFRNEIYETITGNTNYLKKLNLPSTCSLPSDSKEPKICKLTNDDLKNINFENKPSEELTVTNNGIAQFKIEKIGEIEHNAFKFTLQNSSDITIKKSESTNFLDLKTETDTEFKIQETNGKYYLTQTWKKESELLELIGLNCSGTECSPKEANKKIKVFKDKDNYSQEASFGSSHSNKKITLTKNTSGYNQGFKLTVSEDITLSLGTNNKKGTVDKLSKDKVYEIGTATVGTAKEWFLIEKDSQAIKEKLTGMFCATNGESTTCQQTWRPIATSNGQINVPVTKTPETSDTNNYPDKFKYSYESKNYKIEDNKLKQVGS